MEKVQNKTEWYKNKLKIYDKQIEQIAQQEQTVKALTVKDPENAVFKKMAMIENLLGVITIHLAKYRITELYMHNKKEAILNDMRQAVYKLIIYLEEIVSNYIDAPYSDYSDKLQLIAHISQKDRYFFIRKMGLVIDCADLDAGDEVIIKDVAGRKLGSAVSQKGRAVVSVWGDNPFTHEIEGAANGELLIIEVYHNSLSKEIIPRVKYSKSLINKRASELVFTDNELLVVEVELNSAITNVIDGEESCMINVYPNPAHDYIIIGINCDDAIESMSIYDVSGARVANVNKTTGNNKIRFNVERFNSGVYFLRTKIGSEIYENKIIVQ